MKMVLPYKIKRIIKIPYNIYLCLRFPFLYPKNRFTGKHYNNWAIWEKIKKIYEKYPCPKSLYNEDGTFVKIDQNVPKRFKLLIWFLKFTEKFLSLFHCIPTYTELDYMPNGWRKAFGIQMMKDLKIALKRTKSMKWFRIMDIKEKWGELCFYCNGYNDDIDNVIGKYEYISRYTCISCGKPAHFLSTGWISPYCRDCSENGYVEMRDFYGRTKISYEIIGDTREYVYNDDGELVLKNSNDYDEK